MARKRRSHSTSGIFFLTLLAVAVLVVNVFLVSVGKVHARSGTDLSQYVNQTNYTTETIKALRGTIYDRNGSVIGQDSRTYNIICVLDENRPALDGEIAYVKDKEYTAEVLSKCLRMDYDTILEFLYQDRYQTELGTGGRKISKDVKDQIESYELPGIEFTDSIQRVYPLGQFSSNLIGYAQSDETGSTVGQMGLELFLDSYLKGKDGSRTYQVDKNGYVLPSMNEVEVSAVNGNNVYLTLDAGIQSALEEAFEISDKRFDIDYGFGAVMELNTGRVVGWGQFPTFDPNSLDDIEEYNNIGAQLPYEPGSTLKSFVWAAAINEGRYDSNIVTDGNQFCFVGDANNNPVRTYSENNDGCVYNARKIQYGSVDLDHGLIFSLNTVSAAIQAELISPEIHLDYLRRFGFFKPVDTDGIPEVNGVLNFDWASEKVNLSFGQGSTVSVLQMIQAYSAIFTDGTMKKPYFVETIRDSYDNSVIYQAETKITGNPITEETAKQVQEILYHTANDDNATARYFKIPECKILAKTGTSEVAINGSYDNNVTITSIMAALPADNPQILVYYGFQADGADTAHYYTEAANSLLRKVAMTYNLSDNMEEETEEEETEIMNIVSSPMPNVVNHSLDFAHTKLDALDVEIVTLGEGSTVIAQFPTSTSSVFTKQRVFLLTDATSFIMPDCTGWTRKDIAGLWAVTGFGFQLSGDGKVVSQNIPPGTVVNKGTEIEIVFE